MNCYKNLYRIAMTGSLISLLVLKLICSSAAKTLKFYSFALLPFTIISIVAALQYRKLPKSKKVKPALFSSTLSGIHPYAATAWYCTLNLGLVIYTVASIFQSIG